MTLLGLEQHYHDGLYMICAPTNGCISGSFLDYWSCLQDKSRCCVHRQVSPSRFLSSTTDLLTICARCQGEKAPDHELPWPPEATITSLYHSLFVRGVHITGL
jgi:hypothetical protein